MRPHSCWAEIQITRSVCGGKWTGPSAFQFPGVSYSPAVTNCCCRKVTFSSWVFHCSATVSDELHSTRYYLETFCTTRRHPFTLPFHTVSQRNSHLSGGCHPPPLSAPCWVWFLTAVSCLRITYQTENIHSFLQMFLVWIFLRKFRCKLEAFHSNYWSTVTSYCCATTALTVKHLNPQRTVLPQKAPVLLPCRWRGVDTTEPICNLGILI